jgi:protein-tyrosine phosphatase
MAWHGMSAGRNRSVTTLAIWLVLEGLCADLPDALTWIKACRPQAEPDPKYLTWAHDFIPAYRQNFREWVRQ